jgi:tryptophan-rich sensory protein
MQSRAISRIAQTSLGVLALSLLAVFAVGALGGLATSSSVDTWYGGLQKPAFAPPNVVFGPVWSTLYVCMAVAAWRVWRAEAPDAARRRALQVYGVQLVLNLIWSVIFFGLRQPGAAFLELVLLLGAILLTLRLFLRVDRPAGLLMAPYALWVTFAGLLNFEIWRLNH